MNCPNCNAPRRIETDHHFVCRSCGMTERKGSPASGERSEPWIGDKCSYCGKDNGEHRDDCNAIFGHPQRSEPRGQQQETANVHIEHYFPKGYDPDAEPWKSIKSHHYASLAATQAPRGEQQEWTHEYAQMLAGATKGDSIASVIERAKEIEATLESAQPQPSKATAKEISERAAYSKSHSDAARIYKPARDDDRVALAAEREHRKLLDKVLDNRCLQLRKMEEALATERQRREQAEEQLNIRATEYVPTTKFLELRERLLSALAAIEKVKSAMVGDTEWPNLEVIDLSALHEHDAELLRKRDNEWFDACCGVPVIDVNPQAVKKWIASEAELMDAEVRKPLVDTLRFFKGELRSVGAWTPECQKAYDDALAKVKEQ